MRAPGAGCFALAFAHACRGIAAIELAGFGPERVHGGGQLALGDRQQPVDAQADALLEPELLLELLPPQPERGARLRRQLGLERLHVGADGVRRLGRGIGQVAQHVQVVHLAERARQVALDEPKRAVEGLDADLHEDAGRILDVVTGGLNEPRDLPELREHPARAFGGRGEREQRLRRQAGGDRVRVQVRVPLPGPRLLQLEHPRLDVVGQHRLLGALDVLQPGRVDLGQPAGKPRQGPEVGLDGRAAVVLEQVVMRVDPVEGSDGGTHLLQVAEVVVHEVWQRLGRIHGRQKPQWYNTSQPPTMPGAFVLVATPIGNLEDMTLRGLRSLREADLIAAEDTRHTGKLLTHFGITTPTVSLHEHNERSRIPSCSTAYGGGSGSRS